ncbi:MAG: flagellar biosynthesis protein FlhF [Gammaproteobacteria bacterium]|nr:MAG: flagellar biosynthesis protein FlhF [Gammaproteobacteria bacterium]
MKIKRFFAPDMRQAIRKVRETLGPDAVILSNRRVAQGVELVAAIDYDEQQVRAAAEPAAPAPESGFSAVAADPGETPGKPEALDADAEAPDTAPGVPGRLRRAAAGRGDGPGAGGRAARRSQLAPEWLEDPAIGAMRAEIQELRTLLEHQLAHLAWGELKRTRPVEVEVLRRLDTLGLPPAIGAGIARQVADEADPEQAWHQALALLAGALPVAEDPLLDQGGVVALVGSTGVGKTTTIAKLAARFALRHGPRSLALVSTDSYRIGAQEQLVTYGRLLGVHVQVADDRHALEHALRSLADRRLVLIDTAGMSQRDLRLAEQFTLLEGAGTPVSTYLALSATTQAAVLEETITAFGRVRLRGAVLTKTDEAATLGGVLGALIRHRLPVAWVCDGQRVPEDLQPARAQNLVNRALALMQQHGQESDDSLLAERFGPLAANSGI